MTAYPTEHGETLYVIVPCLNEQENIEPVAREILSVVPSLPVRLRVLLVDDGSTDGTLAAMEKVAASDSLFSVRRNPSNLGLGRSVLETLASLPPEDWVTTFPGDNEFVFSSVTNFLAERERYDLMLGYLYNPVVRTFRRRLASYLFTKVVAVLYGFPWRYLNGMKLYRARVFQGLEVVSSGHAFMAEAIAKAQLRRPDLRIGEVPFYSRGRATGRSKAIQIGAVLSALSELARGARSVARYRRDVLARPRAPAIGGSLDGRNPSGDRA